MKKAKMKIDQFAEFASAIVRSLPRDMGIATVQGWIKNQKALEKVLREALMLPKEKLPSEIYAADRIPKGWEIAILNGAPQDVEAHIFRVKDLSFKSFLQKNDHGSTISTEMLQRAVTMGVILVWWTASFCSSIRTRFP